MPKGRPRKPIEEKRQTGSVNVTREKRLKEFEMKASLINAFPKAPKELGVEGKRVWELLAQELTQNKVLAKVDTVLLTALCLEWELYILHRMEQKKKGVGSFYELETKFGVSIQPHPIHYNGTNHLKEFVRLCNEFGLSPAARARIGIAHQETAKSKAAELLKKAV